MTKRIDYIDGVLVTKGAFVKGAEIIDTYLKKNNTNYQLLKCSCGKQFTKTISVIRKCKYDKVVCAACAWLRAATKRHENFTLTGLKRILWSYESAAKKRGLCFELTMIDIEKLSSNKCHYCTGPPSNKMRISRGGEWQYYAYQGIDRLDNNIGYIASNCVPCCKICNISKNNLTNEEWRDWISRLVQNFRIDEDAE